MKDREATILVVDDNQVNRTILGDLIRVIGHKPVLLENGEQALNRIYQKPSPDLVLLDIMMPGVDGYEVLERVKSDKFLLMLPIIMITAVDDMESQIRCIEKGADDYIIKPFNSILLKARINALLDKKRLYEQEQQFNFWIAESYQKLQKAESVRDSLFHMIVHDLNNPLCVIQGQAELLQIMGEKELTPQKVRDISSLIINAADSMAGMTRQILDVASLEDNNLPVRLELFNLNDVISEVSGLYGGRLDETGGSLHVDAEQPLQVFADRQLVQRILHNLITNSLKYTKSHEPARISITARKQDDTVSLAVSDNGMGIAPEDQEKIFNRFYRAGNRKTAGIKGLGLGLTFCKLAAEAMHGSIAVASEPDRGATFTLTLPASPPARSRASDSRPVSP